MVRKDDKCINGHRYRFEEKAGYIPIPERDGVYVVGVSESESTDDSPDLSSATLLETMWYLAEQMKRTADASEAIAVELANQNAWGGQYRRLDAKIPAMEVNYEVDWSFLARVFILNSAYPLEIRLGSKDADPIVVDSETSAIKMANIHHTIAFSKIYVTNYSSVEAVAKLTIFG